MVCWLMHNANLAWQAAAGCWCWQYLCCAAIIAGAVSAVIQPHHTLNNCHISISGVPVNTATARSKA